MCEDILRRNHNPHSFVDITGSPCAHFGAVSYVVSYQGAKKLLKYLIPFKNCIDVEILNLIEEETSYICFGAICDWAIKRL